MKSCQLCNQKCVDKLELELHLASVHGLSGQASSTVSNKRKSPSNEGVAAKKG